MTKLPPHAVAGIDQERAGFDAELDGLVARCRDVVVERGEAQMLADMCVTFNALYAAETRGDLLAAAVLRLATGGA